MAATSTVGVIWWRRIVVSNSQGLLRCSWTLDGCELALACVFTGVPPVWPLCKTLIFITNSSMRIGRPFCCCSRLKMFNNKRSFVLGVTWCWGFFVKACGSCCRGCHIRRNSSKWCWILRILWILFPSRVNTLLLLYNSLFRLSLIIFFLFAHYLFVLLLLELIIL